MCVNVTDDTKILDYTMVLHDLHGGKSRSCIYISAYIIKDKPNFISLGFYDISNKDVSQSESSCNAI